jgi:hypothetical protein
MMSIESFMHSVGLGRVYYEFIDYNPDDYTNDFKELVYFKKGEEEWGEMQTIVGLKEFDQKDQIVIYPNPASDYISIQSYENTIIQIYNSTGQLLLSDKTNSTISQIKVSSFPSGVYFVSLLDEEGFSIGKLKFLKR